MNKPTTIRNFNMGGLSESRILGENNSSLFKMIGTDVHSRAGLLKANRRLTNSGGATIDALAKVQVACSNGKVYTFSSSSGKIWEYSSGSWSLKYTVASPNGGTNILGAYEYNGYLYWATQNYLYRIQLDYVDSTWSTYVAIVGHLNSDPVVGDGGFLGASTNSYSLLTSVNESAPNFITFTPQLKTISGIAINVGVKPSTSLTVKVHDSANTEIATATVANANLAVGINEIYFSSPVSYIQGATYHIHIYQTGTGGTVKVTTTSELTDAYLEIYGESDTNYHPMTVVNNILYIGDGRYVHQVENVLTLWALDIPLEQNIRCLYRMGIELLIGTEVSSSIHSAMIFRWNTWSESWTIEDEIPERSINAFIPVDNFVYIIAGNKGNVYFYDGSQLQLYRRIGGEFGASDAININPNATSSLDGIPLIGVSNTSGNPIESGVYGFGTINPRLFPRIFDLEFVPSAGYTDVEIGSIVVSGTQIFVAWKKSSTYGVDIFDNNELYSGTTIQSRVIYQDRNRRATYHKLRINYADIQTNNVAVTIANSGDLFTASAHGLQNDEPVKFTGASLPAQIVAGTEYYVINKTTNTFQVSATVGGSAVVINADGSGTLTQSNLVRAYKRADYATSWTEIILIQDTDKKQFINETMGDNAFCFEIKIELRSRGTACPVIDEISLETT